MVSECLPVRAGYQRNDAAGEGGGAAVVFTGGRLAV